MGYYFVEFDRAVSFCGYVATTDGYAGPNGTVQGAAYGYSRRCSSTPVRAPSASTRRSTWRCTAEHNAADG
jgi:hypothetical protein